MPVFIVEGEYDARRKITPEYVIDAANPKEAACVWAKFKTKKPGNEVRTFCHSVDGARFDFWFATLEGGDVWIASPAIYSAYLFDGPKEWPASEQLKEPPPPSTKESLSFWQRVKTLFGVRSGP